MVELRARRVLAGACAIALLLTGAAFTATPADAARPAGKLTFSSVSVSPTNVDASTGSGKVTLTWAFKDTVAGAQNLTGNLTLRRTDGSSTYTVPFDFLYDPRGSAEGTIQHPTFTYDFPVPKYARTTSAQYQVTKIAATDDKGGAVTVTGAKLAQAKFTAVQAADTTAPTYDDLQLAGWSKKAVYNRDRSGTVTYWVTPHDAEAGLSGGKLVVKGPGGATLTAPFSLDSTDSGVQCDLGPQDPLCTVDLTIPATAAAGTWTLDQLTLTDAAGNTARYDGLNTAPIVVSANRQIQATDFAFDPPNVDNWRETKVTHLKFKIDGVRQGLSAAHVKLNGLCSADPSTPAITGGTVDIAVTVPSIMSDCTVSGITLTDNAGDTSLYGTDFGAPDLGLVVRRTPDTEAPVADSARLYWTVLPDGTDYQVNNSVIAHTISHVGVTGYSVTVFDSEGASVGGGDGGVRPDESGNVSLLFSAYRTMAPGTYTVAFTLTDAGDLYTHYGYPNTGPPPGGPLTFVIPAS